MAENRFTPKNNEAKSPAKSTKVKISDIKGSLIDYFEKQDEKAKEGERMSSPSQ